MTDKLDKIADSISRIDRTLAGQAVQLADHIRRTQLVEDDIKPIKVHVARIDGAAKLLGIISLFAVVATGVVDVLKWWAAHVGH